MDCFKCKQRNECKMICKRIEKKLPKMGEGVLPHTITLNGDYMDRVVYFDDKINVYKFAKPDKERGV